MAFRIGKSVMMNFGNGLEPLFIFIGLAFLLLIGPLLRWYLLTMTQYNFKFQRRFTLELVPFFLVLIVSSFVTRDWFNTSNRKAIILFASVLIFIYLHLAFYIVISGRQLRILRNVYEEDKQTKSQKAIFKWLRLVIIGFAIIWLSYVLNIVEKTVPYIVGPVVYSVAIYFLSFKAFQLKSTDIDGSVFKENDNASLFNQISELVIGEKMYLESSLSLSILSKLLGQSTQKTSEVINQYAKQNFNDFINYYRIQEAKKTLLDENSMNYTISSIAFDVGFSSLSSFNSAFKKFVGKTPSVYRKTTNK